MTIETPTNVPTAQAVLDEISRIIEEILDEYEVEDIMVTRETLFQEDLELESIDLVTLGGKLREIYGERINFAEFLGSLELAEIITMNVGQLVDYVTGSLDGANASDRTGASQA